MFDVKQIRNDFPILSSKIDQKPLIYLDNAASTQKPQFVIDAITNFYSNSYSNVHRSPHRLGADATDMFEGARVKVGKFLNAYESEEVIFTRGTTESINLLAGIAAQQILQPDDVILLTLSEHHSNLIPWQMAAARVGAKLEFVQLLKDGSFDIDRMKENWNPKTKIFAFQHASNVMGTVHPVKELCAYARERNVMTVIDGAQSVPHMKVDVQELGCDFYAFSAHKMCGPTGIGVLWGKREMLERFDPIFGGGEMINKVDLENASYNVIPYKYEPGTPNIAGAIGMGAAVDYLTAVGLDDIERYVDELATYAVARLAEVPDITLYGPPKGRTGAVSFWVGTIHPHDIASILDMNRICIRAGHHCAEPLMHWLNVPATARASFYFYNTKDEVDTLVESLQEAYEVMGYVNK